MTADLEALVRVRDWQLDRKRRELGILFRRLDDLKVKARAFEHEVTAEQEIARFSPDEAGMAYGGYARRVFDQRAEFAEAIADAEAAVSAAKDDVARAYRDLKTLEIAQENRERREAAETARSETNALDEVALQGFRQRLVDR